MNSDEQCTISFTIKIINCFVELLIGFEPKTGLTMDVQER